MLYFVYFPVCPLHGSRIPQGVTGSVCESRTTNPLLSLVHMHWNFVIAVETDWNCAVSHDDPICLRFDLRIPDRSSSIESYVVGQHLIDSLEMRGLLTHEGAKTEKTGVAHSGIGPWGHREMPRPTSCIGSRVGRLIFSCNVT